MKDIFYKLFSNLINHRKLAYGYNINNFQINNDYKNNYLIKIENNSDLDSNSNTDEGPNDELTENESSIEDNQYFDEEIEDDELESTEPKKNDGDKKPKNNILSKLMKKPQTYLFIITATIIIFVALIIIVLFSNTKTQYVPKVLCSGPSKLDKIVVVTTDSEGVPLESWDFYRYIAAKLLSELGVTTEKNYQVPYQVQSIAMVSKLLNINYKPELLQSNLEKYKEWCSDKNVDKIKILCPVTIEDDLEVLIVENDLFLESKCNLFTGCYQWKNEGYEEDFGIKDGDCIDEYQSTQTRSYDLTKTKFCVVKKNLDKKNINIFRTQGYKFKYNDDKDLTVLVSAKAVVVNPIKDEEKKFVTNAADSVRGVLMVNLDGTPALTEYDTSGTWANPACQSGNPFALTPPVENVMCTGNINTMGDLNVFAQGDTNNELKWPVHKILSFWYNYYFASWSDIGRSSCQIYSKKNTRATQAINLEIGTDIKARPNTTPGYVNSRPDFDYVKSKSASLLSIFASKVNSRNQKMANEAGITGEIYKVTSEDIRNDINRSIMFSVLANGVGTGEGVASAAIALANYLETENYRLPYTFGGGAPVDHNSKVPGYNNKSPKVYGIHPSWGKSHIDSDSYWATEAVEAWDDYFPYITHDIPLGMDCLGFLEWALKNGGIDGNILYGTRVSQYYGDWRISRTYEQIEGHSNVGWFGDVLWRTAGGKNRNPHGKLVVGPVFDVNNVLVANQVIESSGFYTGMRVTYVSVVTGEIMKRKEVFSTEPDPNTGKLYIKGYIYEVGTTKDPEASPYAVIDLSGCYNQTRPDICSIDTDENFYKGVITGNNYISNGGGSFPGGGGGYPGGGGTGNNGNKPNYRGTCDEGYFDYHGECLKDIYPEFVYNNSRPYISCGQYSQEEKELLEKKLEIVIEKAGVGTRGAAVEAARFLAGFPSKIQYQGARKNSYIGQYKKKGLYLDPKSGWGCNGNGLDCSDGYVGWLLTNAGLPYAPFNAGTEYKMKDVMDQVKPGDFVFAKTADSSGKLVRTHTAIIIGVDDNYVYVGESRGYGKDDGLKVTKISKETGDKYLAYVVLVTKLYNGEGNYADMW